MRAPHLSAINKHTAQSIWAGERSVSEATTFLIGVIENLQKKIVFITIWTAIFVGSSFIYTKSLDPDYIATTQILLRPRVIINDGPEKLRKFYQLVLDSDQSETELRVLGSKRFLYNVFQLQNLAQKTEHRERGDGLWGLIDVQLKRFQSSENPDFEADDLFNAFLRRVRARRLGLSYVIEISYRGHNAEQATRIVNAIASTYAAYRLRGVLAREQRRGFYLESRLSSLLEQITAAEVGGRLGIIPEYTLFDSDVRLLGPANHPLGIAYPRMIPLMMMMAGFGFISGLLIILLSHGAPVRHTDRTVSSTATNKA